MTPTRPHGPARAALVAVLLLASASACPASTDAEGVSAVGGHLRLDRPVAGDAWLLGGAVEVRAPVGDDLHAAGGSVALHAPVGGDVEAAAGRFTLEGDGRIAGDARIAAGQAVIEGAVGGALAVQGQRVVINGPVGGDATVTALALELGPLARVGGRLRHDAASFTRDPAATVGAIDGPPAGVGAPPDGGGWWGRHPMHPGMGRAPGGSGLWWWILMPVSVALLVLAGVLLLLVSGFAGRATRCIEHDPWRALGLGAALLLGLPLLTVLLFFTVLGIPLGLLLLSVYPPLLVLGWLVGALRAGRWLAARRGAAPADGTALPAGWAVLAVLGLLLLGAVPLLGQAAWAVAAAAGLGGCVLAWRRRAPEPAA